MDAITFLRSSYLGAALAVLFVSLTPPLRDRFLAYGARASKPVSTPPSSMSPSNNMAVAVEGKDSITEKSGDEASAPSVLHVLDLIAQWKVPHSYFWTFYLLSTALSAFWLAEVLFLHGPAYQTFVRWTAHRTTSMSLDQLKITWVFFFGHCAWRLHESLPSPSRHTSRNGKTVSKMWIGHWLIGLMFYVLTNVAIWIEGLQTLERHTLSYKDISCRAPSFRMILAVLIFILASGLQSDCHAYLADLKSSKSEPGKPDNHGYRMPTHPLFHTLIAPHYTAECAKYFALALVAAPPGSWMNWTLFCALVFTAVNLGITARGTRQWYCDKFGPEATEGKWNLIPGVY